MESIHLNVKTKVTIYRRGGYGNFLKIEAMCVRAKARKFAQFSKAVEIVFREPHKRRERGFWDTSHSNTLVLEGWGHPDPEPPRKTPKTIPVRWRSNFDRQIKQHLKATKAKVLLDLRDYSAH